MGKTLVVESLYPTLHLATSPPLTDHIEHESSDEHDDDDQAQSGRHVEQRPEIALADHGQTITISNISAWLQLKARRVSPTRHFAPHRHYLRRHYLR